MTGIDPAKRRAGWMEIRLDGASPVVLPEEDVVRLGLIVGCGIPSEELERVRRIAERAEATRVAVRYLSARPRSCREVELRLRRDRFDPRTIEATVDRLVDLGYLDDQSFAAAFSRDRIRLRPCGVRRLRSELGAKGVAPNDAEAGIRTAMIEEEVSEAELLDRVAAARAARLGGVEPDVARRRLYGYLERRGFAPAGIRAWVESNWEDETE